MEHYFSIQLSKNVFYREDLGIVPSVSRIGDPERLNLKSLLVYGISIDCIPILRRRYCFVDRPLSIREFLSGFWQSKFGENVAHLSGLPDCLVFDRKLKGLIDESVFEWLTNTQVSFRWSNGREKRFTAKMRNLQEYPFLLASETTGKQQLRLETLNKHQNDRSRYLTLDPKQREYAKQNSGRSYDVRCENDIYNQDITIDLDQLNINSVHDEYNQEYVIEYGYDNYPYLMTYDSRNQHEIVNSQIIREDITPFVRLHPIGIAGIAKTLGLTKHKLKKYLSGGDELSLDEEYKLCGLISAELREGIYENYLQLNNEARIIWCHHGSEKDVNKAWETITNGGNSIRATEVIPNDGRVDPSYRLIVIQEYDSKANLLLFRRGERTSTRLDDQNPYINFTGQELIPPFVYSQLLALTCAAGKDLHSYKSAVRKLEKLQSMIEDVLPEPSWY